MKERAKRKEYISNKIKSLRGESGWSQAELAKKSGISPAAISLIEKKERLPSMMVTRKLASTLKVSIDELTGVQSQSTGDISKEAQIFFRNWQALDELEKADKDMILSLIERLKEQKDDSSGT